MSLRILALSALFCLFGTKTQAAIQMDAYVATNRGTASHNNITTPGFGTSSASELLLAFVATGYKTGNNSFVKTVTGAGLSWSLVKRVNTQRGTAEIWRALAPNILTSVTVRANLSQKVPASLTVMSFSGVDFTNPIGSIGEGTSPSGLPTASLVTTQPDSLVIGVGVDGARTLPRTPGQEQNLLHQFLASGATFWLQSLNQPVAQPGTNVTINDTAPDGGPYNLVIVEVVGAFNSNPTADVSGNVQSSIGEPLGGAQVSLSGGTSAPLSTTTDSSGSFSFPGVPNGSYAVAISLEGYTFAPSSHDISVNGADVSGVNFVGTSTAPTTHAISGTVTSSSGGGLSSVAVSLSGQAGTFSATTDSSGNYMFSSIPDGNYTLTPSRSGFSFSPPSQSVTLSGSDRTGVDFTATALTFSVSGTVTLASGGGLAGVTMTLNGSSPQTTVTNSSGQYNFSNVSGGTYTVTPSLTGYNFNPVSQNVSVTGSNVASVDFGATPQTFSISGTITNSAGGVLPNVAVTLGGSSGTIGGLTDSAGRYVFSGVANGTYTLTPALTGYTFNPASQNLTIIGADLSSINFVGTAVPAPTYAVSGTVSTSSGGLSGVTMTLQGSSGSVAVTTDSSGNYSFSGVANGTYTLMASRTGYNFNPASQSVVVNGANRAGVNVAATLITYTISGTISTSGGALSGATVTLNGPSATQTATTNSSGQYSFSGAVNGTYTVSPSRSGYTFNPTSQSVTVASANRTGINFTGALITYSISGTISSSTGALSGVTVSMGSLTTTTNTSGQYTFAGVVNGTYVITPTRAGYVFNPVNRTVTVSGANIGSMNFTGSLVTYSVTLAWDAVTLNADGTPVTNLGGYRIYYGTSSGSYTSNVDAGNLTQFTVPGLTAGIYYFAVKAYNTAGSESVFSSEVNNGPTAALREFVVAVPAL